MIIGMDSDDHTAFQRTIDFIEATHIMDHNCHPLMAPAGTRLWHRLEREGRLVRLDADEQDRMDILTNIIPKKMTRTELMEGLADYSDVVHDPAHFARRVIGFIHGVKRKPQTGTVKASTFWKFRKMMWKTFVFYTFGVSAADRKAYYAIMRQAMKHAPFLMPKLMFIYTSFLITKNRAARASQLARESAAWERAHPEKIKTVKPRHSVSPAVRTHQDTLCRIAYDQVRGRVQHLETLCQVVTEALTDYAMRFGAELETVDDMHKRYVRESCDRVLAVREEEASAPGNGADAGDTPPATFTRDVMDSLDYSLRAQA
jgi:hypothetical protein